MKTKRKIFGNRREWRLLLGLFVVVLVCMSLAGFTEKKEQSIGQDVSEQANVKSLIDSAGNTDSILLLFTTYSCDSCAAVEQYVNNSVKDEYTIKQRNETIVSRVRVIDCNILTAENLELLTQLIKQYEVPSEEQQVPILFYKSGYLSGKLAIIKGIVPKIEDGSAIGFQLKAGADQGDASLLQNTNLWKLVLTGFLNGLNPCAASMLMMVLSILLMTDHHFLKGSLSYMAGKFIAYMGMGMGVFWVFSVVQKAYFTRVEQIIIICFAALAIILSILNFVDLWNVSRKNYQRVIVQLPKGLRKFNHNMIHRLEHIPAVYLLPALFVMGIVISIGEFFCTGQLYAASILYMAEQEKGMIIQTFWMLFIYVFAMCIPQLIIIMVIHKSRNLLSVSRFALNNMVAVKLIYGLLFLGLFLLFVKML